VCFISGCFHSHFRRLRNAVSDFVDVSETNSPTYTILLGIRAEWQQKLIFRATFVDHVVF
jgi:hypothetical protein